MTYLNFTCILQIVRALDNKIRKKFQSNRRVCTSPSELHVFQKDNKMLLSTYINTQPENNVKTR